MANILVTGGAGYIGSHTCVELPNGRSSSGGRATAAISCPTYRDWETDRKSTRLNSSHSAKSRMPSSA